MYLSYVVVDTHDAPNCVCVKMISCCVRRRMDDDDISAAIDGDDECLLADGYTCSIDG